MQLSSTESSHSLARAKAFPSYAKAEPSPAQPRPGRAMWALPHGSLCLDAQPKRWWGPCQSSAKGFFLLDSDVAFSGPRRPRFWPVFGPFGAAVPLRFAVLRGWLWRLVLGLPEARSRPGTGLPTLTPAQPSPSPVQASLSLAKALPKALSYRIQRCRSRPRERSVFGPFVACLGPPCRCVSPF